MTGFVQQLLPDLLAKLPLELKFDAEFPKKQVTGVVFDSRQVQPGHIFVALEGGNTDGHRYIPKAIERGAIAVFGNQGIQGLTVPYCQVENPRLLLAHLSAAFYDFPARHLTVIGVTGTDGKTTTSNLIFQILLSAGIRAGIISTVNAVIGDEEVDTGFHVTTPEAPEIQQYLARMLAAGLTHVVLEATSHGLAQQRVTGCEFDIGVVTNITHEHLDYHGSFEAYREAKSKLLIGLSETFPKSHGNPRLAVLNRDDSSFEYLSAITRVNQVDYSIGAGATIWADELTYAPGCLGFTVNKADFQIRVSTNLVGRYNVSNCLAALGATVVGLGIPVEIAVQGIEKMPGVPGRMERIVEGQDFTAIVDFAHTPNALKLALETARQMTAGRVLVVFGSAGLRDRAKRRMMAEISVELADCSILTAEDPRTESLDEILTEMAIAAKARRGKEGVNFWRVADRGEAIRKAISMAQPGDVVIACGKGHEQSMCCGTVEYPWDDRIAMRAALAELLACSGPKMPYLPTQNKGG